MSVDSINDLPVVNTFAQLPADFYTRLPAQPLTRPRLLHANTEVAALLGLSAAALQKPEFLDVCAGTVGLKGGDTLAAVYSGHQFGIWAGQLGDGRAHLLGEVVGPQVNWELQLKGSGLTPYSRMGDGRAVVRSSVREYLASEAMAGLGIPTTRALALVVADDPVYRETIETAAVVTRVSPTFIRFGSFEHWSGHPQNLEILVNYVVDKFYPQCRDAKAAAGTDVQRAALAMLGEVVERSARMVADWQTVGFCHGVMNTDNMSILGLTLDYGPYGFMDAFQINHVCNHTDSQGRYAWNAQPSVVHWNLYRLANSLIGLDLDADDLRAQLQTYEASFLQAYQTNLVRKFGWLAWQPGDDVLVDDWWRLLHTQQADFTLAFRYLAHADQHTDQFLALFSDREAVLAWLTRYQQRCAAEGRSTDQRSEQMLAANPLYVLRNHLAEIAIQAAQQGDAGEIDTLLQLLRKPFVARPGYEKYAAPAPDWARDLEVSCSS